MKKVLLAIGILMAFAVAHQLNGIYAYLESVGLFPVSDVAYQFFDDLGNDLSILIASIAVIIASKTRPMTYLGTFIGLFVITDMTGMVANPNHYDGFAWELGCAGFSGLCILIYHFFTKRKVRHYEWRGAVKVNDRAASPPLQTRVPIGFVYTKKD